VRSAMLSGDKSNMPGLIRASFGLHNTLEEVDYLVEALDRIARGDYQGKYIQEKATGEYKPLGWDPGYEKFFTL
jgi:hypothetical protein